ncbi:MAG: S41 family peptidase [Bacteroidales bacterium]|nr:S41 family peptidase [Bacteroidales bacterium]
MKKLLLIIGAATGLCLAAGSALAQSRSNKTDVSRNLTIFNSLVKELQTNYVDSIDANKLVKTAIDAMLQGIDPYTEYYPSEDQEELTSIASGQYGGIGAYILKRGDEVIIHQPVWDAPARNAGLRHGDVILKVDSTVIKASTQSDAVSKLLRGQPGSKVTVSVRRPYVADSLLTFEIVRRNIQVNPMPYYGVDSTGIGYIRLTTFNEKSAGAVRDALVDMKRDPSLKGLTIDLRGNGGGLLESAVQIAGLFVPKGTEIVRTRGFETDKEKIYKTTQAPVDLKLPLVILTDESTASASEILAGSLQDLDRAVIVGERSFGKGLVQTTRPLPFDGLLKVTVARYYIPSGRLIQAIDYSHRNPDGSVARIPDSLTRVWHTAAGREVRDGGGITPDITVTDSTMNRLLYNVIADMWAYDYANRYAARNPETPDVMTWVPGDSVFADFKAFIDPARFKYDRMCEQGIDYLRDAARIEGYLSDSVAAQIDILAGMMRHDLDHDLNFNRDRLLEILDSEIGERYFSDGDLVRRNLRYDAESDTARAVLLDQTRYNSILKPAAK